MQCNLAFVIATIYIVKAVFKKLFNFFMSSGHNSPFFSYFAEQFFKHICVHILLYFVHFELASWQMRERERDRLQKKSILWPNHQSATLNIGPDRQMSCDNKLWKTYISRILRIAFKNLVTHPLSSFVLACLHVYCQIIIANRTAVCTERERDVRKLWLGLKSCFKDKLTFQRS